MADQESDWLRAAGYKVTECAGPQYGACPVLRGEACFAVDHADVLVYDVWSTGDTETERVLIEQLRETHPGTPIVLTAPGLEFDWVEESGIHGVVTLEGAPSAALLRAAVMQALASAGKAAV
jgi:hypothetical protein